MDKTDAEYCCGFAMAAAMGAPIAEGLRIYRTDQGAPVCYRCIRHALKVAGEQLAAEKRARETRYDGSHG